MDYNAADEIFRAEVLELEKKPYLSDFDTYMIHEMGIDVSEYPISIEKRRKAFHIFRGRTNRENIASFSTMKRWFGIGKRSIPARSQVRRICLSLKVDVKKAEEFLTISLGQSSFIYNSFDEIIWLYCIENHMSNADYDDLKHLLYERWTEKIEFDKEDHSEQLREQFQQVKKEDKSEFIEWVYGNRIYFNEYNRRTMEVLIDFKGVINEQVKQSSLERLEIILRETDFDKWLKERNSKADRHSLIKRYVNSVKEGKRKVSEDDAKNIRELSKIAYSKKEKISYVHSAVFPSKDVSEYISGGRRVSLKHLSDLYNMQELRLRELEAKQMYLLLSKEPKKKRCPMAFYQWCEEALGNEKMDFLHFDKENMTVSEACECLNRFLKTHHRRCVRINRNDLLPMIHYVSQYNYLKKIEKNRKEYDAKNSKKDFLRLAERVLKECGMMGVNEKYSPDGFFLACYQPTDMYSFSDGVEIL